MFNLNKIIYGLLMLLLIELSLFGIYFIVEGFFDKKVSPEKNISLKVLTFSSQTYVEPLREEKKIKVEKIKLTKVKVKSLEELLVHIEPRSELDIIAIKNQMVKPIIYTRSIKLSSLSIADKKEAFINMLIPSILVAKHRIGKERQRVAKLLRLEKISDKDALWLREKRHTFKASSSDELYDKMELHPTSIVIAQAIIESGWGTSRFFEKANNVFGIWSFNEHEERIAAGRKRGNHTVYLKKYRSVEQSISDYFLLLSTKDSYKEFREKRLESQDALVLVEALGKYSELGEVYIENLKNTIKKNELLAYDSYSLDI